MRALRSTLRWRFGNTYHSQHLAGHFRKHVRPELLHRSLDSHHQRSRIYLAFQALVSRHPYRYRSQASHYLQLHWQTLSLPCLPNQPSSLHSIVPQRINPSIDAGSGVMRGVRNLGKRARPPNAVFDAPESQSPGYGRLLQNRLEYPKLLHPHLLLISPADLSWAPKNQWYLNKEQNPFFHSQEKTFRLEQ
jgi:hypothetical protein